MQIIKTVRGVKYVPDEYFSPRIDIIPAVNKLPRIKGFIMRDMAGNIIADSSNVLTPVFYQYI